MQWESDMLCVLSVRNSKNFFLADTLFLGDHLWYGYTHFPLGDMFYLGGGVIFGYIVLHSDKYGISSAQQPTNHHMNKMILQNIILTRVPWTEIKILMCQIIQNLTCVDRMAYTN